MERNASQNAYLTSKVAKLSSYTYSPLKKQQPFVTLVICNTRLRTRVMKDCEAYGWDDKRKRHPVLFNVSKKRLRFELWHDHDRQSEHDREGK